MGKKGRNAEVLSGNVRQWLATYVRLYARARGISDSAAVAEAIEWWAAERPAASPVQLAAHHSAVEEFAETYGQPPEAVSKHGMPVPLAPAAARAVKRPGKAGRHPRRMIDLKPEPPGSAASLEAQ